MKIFTRIGIAGSLFLGATTGLATGAEAGGAGLAGPIPATVTRVIDGDTVEVDAVIWLDQKIKVAVRLDGLDAPEIRRSGCAFEKALGRDAKQFLADQLHGKDIALYGVKEGKYAGRVVARIKTSDGAEPALALLEEGLAAPRPKRGKGKDWCTDRRADAYDDDVERVVVAAAKPREQKKDKPVRPAPRSFRQAFAPDR